MALSDGGSLEVLRAAPLGGTTAPPVLLVHGSYHAAWCWAEHWLPWLAQRGVDAAAVSLRCQGRSADVAAPPGAAAAGTLATHAADLAEVVEQSFGMMPVLVGHSFGGLVVMEYASSRSAEKRFPPVAGIGLLCSVPPEGNSEMVGRFLKTAPLASARITWSFVTKAFERDPSMCRETFFSADLPDADLMRYMDALKSSSARRLLDLSALKAELPVPPPPSPVPTLVLGAADDFVVDSQAVCDTAMAYGVAPLVLPATAHDLMLDTRWEQGAEALLDFVKSL